VTEYQVLHLWSKFQSNTKHYL